MNNIGIKRTRKTRKITKDRVMQIKMTEADYEYLELLADKEERETGEICKVSTLARMILRREINKHKGL